MNAVEMNQEPVVGQQVLDKVYRRILPFILLCYIIAYIDRTNIGFAALQMNHDLGLTPQQYAFGGGIFFIGYMLCEVPSNWLIASVGARRWLARIMVGWGLVACATIFTVNARSFYTLRFLLGLAEAGFFPGVIFYLTRWFPAQHRNRVMGYFILGVPLSFVVSAPLSGYLMTFSGWFGLPAWKWLFVLEGLPAIILGVLCLFILCDGPQQAKWLSEPEREWLIETLAKESGGPAHGSFRELARTLFQSRVWAAGLAYMGINFGTYGISLWLPQILKAFGMTNLRVGVLSMLPYAFAVVAIIVWTQHADRTNEQRWHAVLPCVFGALGLVGSTFAHQPMVSIAAFAIATAGIMTAMPTLWALVTKSLGGGTVAVAGAIAMVNSIGQLGGFGGPYLVGYVRQTTGEFSAAMLALALCLMVSAVVLLILGRNKFSARSEEIIAGAIPVDTARQ